MIHSAWRLAVLQALLVIVGAHNLAIIDWPWGGIKPGQRYTIRYVPEEQQFVTFNLLWGPSTKLEFLQKIGNATGGTFTWTVPSDLPNRSGYAIEIRRDNDNNISGQFESTGGQPFIQIATPVVYGATTSASPTTSFVTATSSQGPAQFTGSSGPLGSDSTSTGLSIAAKAGIGVGASIGGLLLLGATFLLGRWATRRSHQKKSLDNEDIDSKPELEGFGKSSLTKVREHEISSATTSIELETGETKHELDVGEKPELEGVSKCEVEGKTTIRYELP